MSDSIVVSKSNLHEQILFLLTNAHAIRENLVKVIETWIGPFDTIYTALQNSINVGNVAEFESTIENLEQFQNHLNTYAEDTKVDIAGVEMSVRQVARAFFLGVHTHSLWANINGNDFSDASLGGDNKDFAITQIISNLSFSFDTPKDVSVIINNINTTTNMYPVTTDLLMKLFVKDSKMGMSTRFIKMLENDKNVPTAWRFIIYGILPFLQYASHMRDTVGIDGLKVDNIDIHNIHFANINDYLERGLFLTESLISMVPVILNHIPTINSDHFKTLPAEKAIYGIVGLVASNIPVLRNLIQSVPHLGEAIVTATTSR